MLSIKSSDLAFGEEAGSPIHSQLSKGQRSTVNYLLEEAWQEDELLL